MLKSGEEILADVDSTLDQLIANADVLQRTSVRALSETELDALQKTQESLLARLLHLDGHLHPEGKERKPSSRYDAIKDKIRTYSQLNARLINRVATQFGAKPKKTKLSFRKRRSIGQ
jgi:hypothetical protein